MSSTAQRLKLSEAILGLIESHRAETGDPELGTAIERVVLEGQMRDLERDIFEDPGAIEPWLIKRRRTES